MQKSKTWVRFKVRGSGRCTGKSTGRGTATSKGGGRGTSAE